MKILVILPILKHKVYEEITYRELSQAASKETEIKVVSLDKGPASIESAYDEALAIPGILDLTLKAEREGYDAVIIDCMGDPGLEAAREIVKIPVIGPCQASIAFASMLCAKFSVVTILRNVVPLFHELTKKYGVTDKIVSVRCIDIPVLELEKNMEKVRSLLLSESKKAIEDDYAEAIILGCTGMIGLAEEIKQKLNVPVIDPAPTALKMAEVMIKLGVSHSKITYPKPPEKTRII